MNEYETILFSIDADRVATIAFNRPEQRNAATPEMLEELRAALREVHRDQGIRVLVLTGVGNTFCPGAGAGWQASSAPELESPILVDASTAKLLYEAPMPTIAAINGACAGVGLALAAACDLRVASASAALRSAFFSVGVAGDMGLPWHLTRLVGPAKAREISLIDRKIGAAEAQTIGLINEAVPDEDFHATVEAMARSIASGPPLAARALKAHYLAAERLTFSDFVDVEFQRHFHILTSSDAAEGLAAFGERRSPHFTGR